MNGETKSSILEILAERPRGLTISEVADETDINRVTASKYLEVLRSEGKLEVREVGQAKLHYAKQETLEHFTGGEG